MDKKKIRFIINPVAGTKSKASLPRLIEQSLDSRHFQSEIITSMHVGHASALAEEAVEEGYYAVVAVGGDGTMNEVARALMHTKVHLGIVPFGSGNGLARHLGIPMQAGKAIELLNHAKPLRMDACTIDGSPYFCTSGVGFDAQIGYCFAETTRRGLSSYAKITLREFASYRPQKYKVQAEGRNMAEVEAFMITCANASQYGNNAYIAPQADVSDGLMDVCIMHPFPLWALPLIAYRIFTKSAHLLPWWSSIRCAEAVIYRDTPGVVHLDGEPGTAGEHISFKVVPSVLTVLAP